MIKKIIASGFVLSALSFGGFVFANVYQNHEGMMQSMDMNAKTLTLTINNETVTVNFTPNAKVLDKNRNQASLNDFRAGDIVRVWGERINNMINNASVVRDVSIPR